MAHQDNIGIRHCSRIAKVEGSHPTSKYACDFCFDRTRESTEHTVLTHFGVWGKTQMNVPDANLLSIKTVVLFHFISIYCLKIIKFPWTRCQSGTPFVLLGKGKHLCLWACHAQGHKNRVYLSALTPHRNHLVI